MAGYLQVEVGETQPHGEGCCKGNGRWYCAAWPIAGLGTCLLLVALSMWKTAQPPKPALEVAKDMGVQELLDLFLADEGQNGQSAIQHHRDGMNFTNASMTANITDIRRQLQDMIQNPLALPIASCTVNVYLVASFIGILGNVINGADVACKKADKTKSVFKADAIVDLLPRIDNIISVKQKLTVQDLLDQGCRIGIETSVSLVAFIAGFLARAANDCAMTIKPVPNPGAGCASDMSLVSAGIAYLTAGAETAQAVCPPYPNDFDIDAEALDIVGGLSRRLRTAAPRDPKVEAAVDDVKEILISRLPALGPLAKTLLDNREFFKLRREAKKNHRRTEKDVKCGFDIAGVVGFTAAVGVFLTAGIMECPAATGLGAEAEAFKMGCSLDISAVIAALTTIAGFMGILATECPEKPDTPAKNLCVTAGFNIVSSLGFMSAALSDVKRQCGAL